MSKEKLYFEMLRIRMIEEAIAQKYPEQKMRCPVHLSIGQEAAAVGICAALRPIDNMVSTHRAHAHYLAKGGSLNGLIGELYGKATGCSRGNGGSMHLIDLSVNFFGSTSIVGGTIPVGVGLSFADYLKGSEAVTVVCIGDAAVEEGIFHEAANFASLHHLKVLFLCENNLYSCFTHVSKRQPKRPLRQVAHAHDLKYFVTKPNDVEDVLNMSRLALRNLPAFIEVPTYRFVQHCGPDNDDNLNYRPPHEIEYWKSKDPLKDKVFPVHVKDEIEAEINKSFEFTEIAPFPDIKEIGAYVFKNH